MLLKPSMSFMLQNMSKGLGNCTDNPLQSIRRSIEVFEVLEEVKHSDLFLMPALMLSGGIRVILRTNLGSSK